MAAVNFHDLQMQLDPAVYATARTITYTIDDLTRLFYAWLDTGKSTSKTLQFALDNRIFFGVDAVKIVEFIEQLHQVPERAELQYGGDWPRYHLRRVFGFEERQDFMRRHYQDNPLVNLDLELPLEHQLLVDETLKEWTTGNVLERVKSLDEPVKETPPCPRLDWHETPERYRK